MAFVANRRHCSTVLVLSLQLVLSVLLLSTGVVGKCSWDNCPKWSDDNEITNVHIISHTHDDMGWLKTVDDYFTGRNHHFSPVGVQYIFNTVIDELLKDPSRRFCYAETGFLQRYLDNQTPEQVKRLHKLIYETGQLELVGGGWVQPDEAASHYYELIDQYTLGLGILKEKYGECGVPKVGWQLDPFGHSREHANLLTMMGFEALYFSRQHYAELERRLTNKTLEFIWNTSDDLKTSIFTQTFYLGIYTEPRGFCFDVLCQSEPIIDNPNLEGYNANEKAKEFLALVDARRETQNHNHVMMPMGNDFYYSNANMWFTNLDKLIKAVHNASNGKVNMFYSTPTCYINAVKTAYKHSSFHLTEKNYDFFPHSNGPSTYWTGYFTSKPALKRNIRSASAILQLMRQFNVLAFNFSPDEEEVLERAVSLSVHHDGVTGTAKEFVTFDYTKRLFHGREMAEKTLAASLAKLIAKKKSTPLLNNETSEKNKPDVDTTLEQRFCWLLNETVCDTTKSSKRFALTVFNGNSRCMERLIRIPFSYGAGKVVDDKGTELSCSVTPTFTAFTKQFDYREGSVQRNELTFFAQVPALGYRTYFVSSHSGVSSATIPVAQDASSELRERLLDDETVISNDLIELVFDKRGFLAKYKDKRRKTEYALRQEFLYYPGSVHSGAYIFQPIVNSPLPIVDNSALIELEVVKNALFQEVRQKINGWLSQIIRIFPNKDYVEFDYAVGPLPTTNKDGDMETIEVISRFTVDGFRSNGEFMTDSNGRQLMLRRRDFNPDYTFIGDEPVSANYYPVNSRIMIADGTDRLTVLTDRSQGGSSLEDGSLELMIHRRAFWDDGYGVDEPLDELGDGGRGLVARGRHWLHIESMAEAKSGSNGPAHRRMALEMFHDEVLAFAPLADNEMSWRYTQNYEMSGSLLDAVATLPPQINVLTLKLLSDNSLLLRLEHIYEKSESDTLSQPVIVDVKKLFATHFEVLSVDELMLAANRVVVAEDVSTILHRNKFLMRRLAQMDEWMDRRAAGLYDRTNSEELAAYAKTFLIEVRPMEIKTLNLKVRRNAA